MTKGSAYLLFLFYPVVRNKSLIRDVWEFAPRPSHINPLLRFLRYQRRISKSTATKRNSAASKAILFSEIVKQFILRQWERRSHSSLERNTQPNRWRFICCVNFILCHVIEALIFDWKYIFPSHTDGSFQFWYHCWHGFWRIFGNELKFYLSLLLAVVQLVMTVDFGRPLNAI